MFLSCQSDKRNLDFTGLRPSGTLSTIITKVPVFMYVAIELRLHGPIPPPSGKQIALHRWVRFLSYQRRETQLSMMFSSHLERGTYPILVPRTSHLPVSRAIRPTGRRVSLLLQVLLRKRQVGSPSFIGPLLQPASSVAGHSGPLAPPSAYASRVFMALEGSWCVCRNKLRTRPPTLDFGGLAVLHLAAHNPASA